MDALGRKRQERRGIVIPVTLVLDPGGYLTRREKFEQQGNLRKAQ